MHISIQLTTEPIPWPLPAVSVPGAGAWVEFRGVVRGQEQGQPIAALEYEAYGPMAERQMRHILEALAKTYPCLLARVIHRVGIVPVGETALYVEVAAAHRAEAFNLITQFIDRLKQDVPIWKRPVAAAADRPKLTAG